jgi:hypothetical protein
MVLHALPISPPLFNQLQSNLMITKIHETPKYVILLTLLLIHLSYVTTSFYALSLQTPATLFNHTENPSLIPI